MKNQNQNKAKEAKVVAEVLSCRNIHLACLLGTLRSKDYVQTVDSNQRTPSGKPVKSWVFNDNESTEQIWKLWHKPESKDWEEMTEEEKKCVINVVEAFCQNLVYFLADAKGIPLPPHLKSKEGK